MWWPMNKDVKSSNFKSGRLGVFSDWDHKLNFVIFPVFEVYLLINSKANLPATMSRVTLMRHSCWTTLNICIIFEFILMSLCSYTMFPFQQIVTITHDFTFGIGLLYDHRYIFKSKQTCKKIIKYKNRSLSTFSLTICNNASFKWW